MSRFDDIKARVAAASEEPWTVEADGFNVEADIPNSYGTVDDSQWHLMTVWRDGDIGPDRAAANAEFCAHARTDVPWLVQRVERLERALAAVEWTGEATSPDSQELKWCPWCRRTELEGHAATCLRQAVLAEDA